MDGRLDRGFWESQLIIHVINCNDVWGFRWWCSCFGWDSRWWCTIGVEDGWWLRSKETGDPVLRIRRWQVCFLKFFEAGSAPNVTIPVEFTTTNLFVADIAVPCQLYYSLLVYLLSFWLAAHHSWEHFVSAKSSRLEPMQRTVFRVQIVARSTA